MRRLVLLIFLVGCSWQAGAQTSSIIHSGTFKKKKFGMSSNPYKPDEWEKPYFDSAIRTAFPSDLNRSPEKYRNKLIHLIGVVDSVYVNSKDSANSVSVLLNNKYWDYIEDYSIQDEVMFVSEKGDGKFLVTFNDNNSEELDYLKNFPAEKKLLFVYGDFKEVKGGYPVIAARQIKSFDYELYSTTIMSYEIKRDKNGDVETDKKGKPQVTNFNFLKIAKRGQNK